MARAATSAVCGSVAIVIPAYNSAHYLSLALRSVFRQTYANFEVIVVDDGSDDQTAAVVRGHADARLRYVYQHNLGVAAARNTGILLAESEYLAFLDADDEWEPEFLERCVATSKTDGKVGGAYTSYAYIDPLGRVLPQAGGPVVPPHELHSHLIQDNFLLIHSVLIRAAVVRDVGLFDTRLGAQEDWDFWLRVTGRYLLRGINEPLARYRVVRDSRSFDPAAMHANRMRVLAKHFGPLDNHGSPAITRRAYAYGYRSSAFDFLRANRSDEGCELLSRSVDLAPELLERVDTFYELAANAQPRGYRGNVNGLDLAATAQDVLSHLDLVLDRSGKTARRKAVSARAYALLALAMLYQQAQKWHSARKYLLGALIARPRIILSPSVLKRVVRVLACEAVVTVRTGLVDRAASLSGQWLILILIAAVLFQMHQLAATETHFLADALTRPAETFAPYPELHGGPAWAGQRSDLSGGDGWQSLLTEANHLVPDRQPILFVWPAVLKSDAVANYAYLQAVYALYPRPVELVFAPADDSTAWDPAAEYAIEYGTCPQLPSLDADCANPVYCADSACLYRLQSRFQET